MRGWLRGRAAPIVALSMALVSCDDLGSTPTASAPAVGRPAPPPIPMVARPKPILAHVKEAHWIANVDVERRELVAHEGFAEDRPADAVEVKGAGTHVHHVDKVQDGFETETYTERVKDGFETETYTDYESKRVTETYTDKERCGEDCSGFGSKRRCKPKYCDRTKTRTVSKQVPVTKTRQKQRYKDVTKTRQVPKYKDVERSAPWFSWRAWEWVKNRTVKRTGDDAELTWPDERELAPPSPLAAGEEERTSRRTEAWIIVTVPDGTSQRFDVDPKALSDLGPATEIELAPPEYTKFRVLRSTPWPAPSVAASPSSAPSGSGAAPEVRASASTGIPSASTKPSANGSGSGTR